MILPGRTRAGSLGAVCDTATPSFGGPKRLSKPAFPWRDLASALLQELWHLRLLFCCRSNPNICSVAANSVVAEIELLNW